MPHDAMRNDNTANQPAEIRQVPVAMLQQMFKVMATRFHAATWMFAPLISDHCC